MKEQSPAHALRFLNVLALVVIVILLFYNRERFSAMFRPKGKQLIQKTAPESGEGLWLNSPTLNGWHKEYNDCEIVFIGVHTPETKEEEDFLTLQEFVR